jgi:small subunit ribosomal protein S4
MKRVKEKKERALGTRLFLKPERSSSPKAAIVRRPYRPGQHGQKRHTVSEYGKQLNEKQKIQVVYGLTNRQLSTLFTRLGNKEKVMHALEHRLDRVVFLLGIAGSVRVARQLVSHGHITVNNRKLTISSYQVRIKDVIAVRKESRNSPMFAELANHLKKYTPPSWLKITSPDEGSGECVKAFNPEETHFPFDINLVGEFYSR